MFISKKSLSLKRSSAVLSPIGGVSVSSSEGKVEEEKVEKKTSAKPQRTKKVEENNVVEKTV